MLEIRNLCKTYKTKKGASVKALDNISLKFPKTGMIFLLGKSGSGKSTLLNVIGGLDNADSGEILVKGETTNIFKQSHFDSYRNTYIGFIFQDYNLLDGFSVGSNIALAMELQGMRANEQKINEILQEVDLQGLGNRKTNELSGGQQQRVAIARALIKNPKIIMADEPTGALDSATGKQVFETLKKLSSDRLVIIVSHDRELSEKYADRIIELKDGQVISDLSKSELELSNSKNISYLDNTIEISESYQLTSKDLKTINDFLKGQKGKTSLFVKPNASNFKFEETKTNLIDTDETGFSLVKSSFSLKNAFKVGGSSLKHKVFRLVITIFLSIQAFTLFGLADSVASYSKRKTTIESIHKSGLNFASISKEIGDTDNDYGDTTALTNEDIEYINEQLSGKYKGVLVPSNESLDITSSLKIYDDNDKDIGFKTRFYNSIAPKEFKGFIEFTNDDISSYGYEMLAGDLPNNFNEVVVSEFVYDCFNLFGYTYLDDTEEKNIKISNKTDLIGKTIQTRETTYTICGIINTNFDLNRYQNALTKEIGDTDTASLVESLLYQIEFESAREYSLINALFVKEGFVADYQSRNKTMFTYPTYAPLFMQGSYFDSASLASKHSSKIYYFGLNNTIDKTHVVVSPLGLLSIMDEIESGENGYDYTKDYTSEKILIKLLGDFTADLKANHNDLYNQYVDDENQMSDVINKLINEYKDYSTPRNQNVYKMLDEYIGKNIYTEAKINGFDFANKEIKLEINNYDTVSENLTVTIIGVCYDTKVRGKYSVILDDETFKTVADDSFGDYSFAVSNLNKTAKTIGDIFDFSQIKHGNGTKFYRYNFVNTITQEITLIDDILQVAKNVFIWVGIIFSLFSSLLLANFITTSIAYKKKDIGILRALGARSIDVFKIFFSESFIIAMINFVISAISTGLIITLIDNAIRKNTGILISVLSFSFRQVGFILLISLFVAFIGTFIPVFKIARKRPVAAIKNSK